MAVSMDALQIDDTLIELALAEDMGAPYFDAASALVFSDSKTSGATQLISKHAGPIIIAGLPLVPRIFAKFSQAITVEMYRQDGDTIMPGDVVMRMSGDTQTLMMAERVILNFLQRLSAIATKTASLVELIKHTPAHILDTRKTTPGWRHLEKYAVQCGGGMNHRMGLYDAMMLKDTHIDLLGGMTATLSYLPENNDLPVIVEVRNEEELRIILEQATAKVTRVLLDNMSLASLKACVDKCRGCMPTEASGGITADTIVAIAETGVDYISVGCITHSAGSVDLSIKAVT